MCEVRATRIHIIRYTSRNLPMMLLFLQVAHLKDRYRCVTTDLPGFTSGDNDDACAESWGYSIDEVVRRLEKTVETESNGQPIAIVAHDWGW